MTFFSKIIEIRKRNIFVRFPLKTTFWNLKTKHFCDFFLQNKIWDLKTNFLCDIFFTGHLTDVLKVLCQSGKSWTEVYKVLNGHAKWLLQIDTDYVMKPFSNSVSEALNIYIVKHDILVITTRNASFPSFFSSTTPAKVFATLPMSRIEIRDCTETLVF